MANLNLHSNIKEFVEQCLIKKEFGDVHIAIAKDIKKAMLQIAHSNANEAHNKVNLYHGHVMFAMVQDQLILTRILLVVGNAEVKESFQHDVCCQMFFYTAYF